MMIDNIEEMLVNMNRFFDGCVRKQELEYIKNNDIVCGPLPLREFLFLIVNAKSVRVRT